MWGEGGGGGGGGWGGGEIPVLHNTRDGSELFLTFRTICNFRGRTPALVRVGGGKGGIPGRLHTCLL